MQGRRETNMNQRTTALSSAALLLAASLSAQASDLDYNYAELRIVDTEVGNRDGDGLRLNGSFALTNEWVLVSGYTTIDLDGDIDYDSLAGGVRGLIIPQLEGRATINYVDLDNSDTYFEVGGDYYFNPVFSAGATLEFGGDTDTLTIGVRWYFGGGRRNGSSN